MVQLRGEVGFLVPQRPMVRNSSATLKAHVSLENLEELPIDESIHLADNWVRFMKPIFNEGISTDENSVVWLMKA